MLKKNDEIEIEITDIGNDGEGIGRYEGMTFFVKGAVIGDRILAGITKLKKTYGYARVVRILVPSPHRVEAPCKVARLCGGCQLQMMSYEKQLEYKQNKVKSDLIRLGGIDEKRFDSEIVFRDIIGMDKPYNYRNKAQYPVGINREGKLVAGFYAPHSHTVIDTDNCMIQHPLADRLMGAVKTYMLDNKVSAYDETTCKGLIRHVLTRIGFTTHEVMVCLVINGKKLPAAKQLEKMLIECVEKYNSEDDQSLEYVLKSLSYNVNTENTNVIMGEELVVLYGQQYITDYIGEIKYQISPLSFYQVNPVQTEKLYSTALKYADLKGEEIVWDLYCGIGTISLFMAKAAKRVYGVEIVPQAIDDARCNAKLNEIDNAEFFVGAAEEVLPDKYKENPEMHADVIMVDPPRKGCDEKLLSCIAKLAPRRVVYVSCDPATLARDIKFLENQGYELKEVQPVEMFGFSTHVETVVLLSKKTCRYSDNYGEI